ncbi:pentatricopeptide repeat-containing protein [Corchorus olitorius]|uniref:Pentatricopeptide repeat-containing protein n=1 Tax=Corchorus olitorius TaxID=93759 RepID=A0A1R3JY85_9ROSI|nr:pentatricopeptide repeat-containing protein [Corchorus olitorius]
MSLRITPGGIVPRVYHQPHRHAPVGCSFIRVHCSAWAAVKKEDLVLKADTNTDVTAFNVLIANCVVYVLSLSGWIKMTLWFLSPVMEDYRVQIFKVVFTNSDSSTASVRFKGFMGFMGFMLMIMAGTFLTYLARKKK